MFSVPGSKPHVFNVSRIETGKVSLKTVSINSTLALEFLLVTDGFR